MVPTRSGLPIVIRAHAKLNLTLRVLATRPDGYHELRTTFQSLALHDTLTIVTAPGPFAIGCDDPACPCDQSNLVWQAAERLWDHLGRRGPVSGVRIRIKKRIPMQAGLGGGSSDAAAALIGLAAAWRARPPFDLLRRIGAQLGADVPFFFDGGTALGLERGDLLFPLPDCRPSWVVLAMPAFGVSTADAYRWWDEGSPTSLRRAVARRAQGPPGMKLPPAEAVNDLERPVVAHHPEVGLIVGQLQRAGSEYAAMSGSGSAVFGLFPTRAAATAAAARLSRARLRVLVTRTLGRTAHQRQSRSLLNP